MRDVSLPKKDSLLNASDLLRVNRNCFLFTCVVTVSPVGSTLTHDELSLVGNFVFLLEVASPGEVIEKGYQHFVEEVGVVDPKRLKVGFQHYMNSWNLSSRA